MLNEVELGGQMILGLDDSVADANDGLTDDTGALPALVGVQSRDCQVYDPGGMC